MLIMEQKSVKFFLKIPLKLGIHVLKDVLYIMYQNLLFKPLRMFYNMENAQTIVSDSSFIFGWIV